MAATQFLARILLLFIQNLPMVGDELDEAMHECMREREEMLRQEVTRLLQEMEQRSLEVKTQEQQDCSWGAALLAALQQWQLWVITGVLLLLSGLCWWFRKRSCNTEQAREEKKEEKDGANELGRFLKDCLLCPVRDVARECKEAEDIVLSFIHNIRERLSNSCFPVLQPPIRVGNAFEGWWPREGNPAYCFLLPLKPPCGQEFHLEPNTTDEMPGRNFRIRVEFVCTCTMEQQVEKMRCFLHHSEEESRGTLTLRRLHPLCTGSYLSVKRTARWLNRNVKSVWKSVPQLFQCHLTVPHSSSSCRLQVIKDSKKMLQIEMIFGVQEGDSDVFLSSQTIETTFTPDLTWPESYAVAEVKFFRHVARQAPTNSSHLRCLRACVDLLVGQRISAYTFKTIVMHLLTTTSFSRQHDPLQQLSLIADYLDSCLKQKRLNHFFFGNENVPQEIVLPPNFRTAEPLNLFQLLAQNEYAYAEAWREFMQLEFWIRNLDKRCWKSSLSTDLCLWSDG